MRRPFIVWHKVLPAFFFFAACSQDDVKTTSIAEEPATKSEVSINLESHLISRTPSTENARVFFIKPANGELVSNPFLVEFGLTGMEIRPAGDNRSDSGHHHIIIDAELPTFDLPIPADKHHIHFGDGSSKIELTLSPSEHTLQLLFADYRHIPHNPPVFSEQITITVK